MLFSYNTCCRGGEERPVSRFKSVMEFLTELGISLCLVLYEVYAKCILVVVSLFPNLIQTAVSHYCELLGVTIDGSEATDIQVVKPENFYGNLAAYKEVGLFDAYVDGSIDIRDLLGFVVKFVDNPKMISLMHPLNRIMPWFNLNTRKNAWEVARIHYDIGNDLYEAMLDKNMQYSCGYWKDAKTLEDAQLAKMDLIAQKLHLEPGMRVLDIGCGFGTLARHLAENYGVSVVGCTVSKAQAKYGREKCKNLDVDIRLCDFRDVDGKYDRVISIEVLQHIGPQNYREFMQVAYGCLKDDGLFLLQVPGASRSISPRFEMWCHKYIYPNCQIPYYLEIAHAMEDLWVIEDWHSFGLHFVTTIAAWEQNFDDNWPKLCGNYSDRFYRMWKMYLSLGQASFLTRTFDIWHIVLSKDGRKQGYVSVR